MSLLLCPRRTYLRNLMWLYGSYLSFVLFSPFCTSERVGLEITNVFPRNKLVQLNKAWKVSLVVFEIILSQCMIQNMIISLPTCVLQKINDIQDQKQWISGAQAVRTYRASKQRRCWRRSIKRKSFMFLILLHMQTQNCIWTM